MIKIVSLLSVCLLAQGCVGIATLKTKTESIQDPRVADNPIAGGLYPRDFNQTNGIAYTTSWLDTNWGKPSSITKTDDGGHEEIWVYKFGTIWSGMVPIILFPIPMLAKQYIFL